MGQRWPVTWRRAADSLRKKSKRTKHLSPDQLASHLAKQGVTGPGQQTLTRWLHELGELLYYGENEDLNDTIMLDPQWVTRIVSRVLDDSVVAGNNAILTRKQMEKLWKEIKPPLREHLLRLMDEFDLSYKVVDEEFKAKSKDRDQSLVVELLPLDKADYDQLWDSKAGERSISMKLELDRNPPAGVPTWFIARSHRFSLGKHWRLGALLADNPKQPRHLALVKASPTEETVTLSVRGPAPHNFFALLNDGLMKTFERFPGLGYKRKVPCPCAPNCEHEFDLEDLSRAIEQTDPVLELLCLKTFKKVSVPEMLFGQRFSLDNPHFKEIVARLGRIEEGVEANLAYQQREFTKLFNALQESEESYCPNVFALRLGGERDIIGLLEPIRSPGMFDKFRETVWKRRIELQLYCQQPGHWHPVGYERGKDDPETGLYQIEIDSDFLRAAGPYLIKLSKVMKYVPPVLGVSLPWIIDEERYKKQFKEDIDRWTKFADTAAKSAPELFDESQTSKIGRGLGESRGAKSVSGYELRALRQLLEERDKDKKWGKLKKLMTKEGHWLWLCEHHVTEYKD
jgi:hypothetical protein